MNISCMLIPYVNEVTLSGQKNAASLLIFGSLFKKGLNLLIL